MFLKRYSFLSVLVSILLASCGVETAKPFRKQHLFIASDCLDHTDAGLFKGFEKNNRIKIHIRHFTADSLNQILTEQGYNTEFDAVILSSVYDMNELNKKGVFQRLHDDSIPETLPFKHRSASRKFFGIGIDPYIILTKDDSVSRVRSYRDLTKKSRWCSDLDGPSNWFPFYAVIAQKIDPKSKYNAVDWIAHFMDNKEAQLAEEDSISVCKTVFTTYSRYRTSDLFKSMEFKKHRIIFPNQRSGGTYFNMPCYGVIKQARNYTNAIAFLRYIIREPANKRLNYQLSMFPLIHEKEGSVPYQNIRFKKYSLSPVRLTANYDRLINILLIVD